MAPVQCSVLLCTHAGGPEFNDAELARLLIESEEYTALRADRVHGFRAVPPIEILCDTDIVQNLSANASRKFQCAGTNHLIAVWTLESPCARSEAV